MPERKALTLYWTKNGNTQMVAERIHDTLENVGIEDSLLRMTKDLEVEYLEYNRVLGVLRQLHLKLPLGDKFL